MTEAVIPENVTKYQKTIIPMTENIVQYAEEVRSMLRF